MALNLCRAVCLLNVIAIIYVMDFGSNLLNDMIVTYVSHTHPFPR